MFSLLFKSISIRKGITFLQADKPTGLSYTVSHPVGRYAPAQWAVTTINAMSQSKLEEKQATRVKRGKMHVNQVTIGFDFAPDWSKNQHVCSDW